MLRLSTAYAMVSNTLDYLAKTTGIEVVVVHVRLPLLSHDELLADVRAALRRFDNIKLAIFSHVSSVVSDHHHP